MQCVNAFYNIVLFVLIYSWILYLNIVNVASYHRQTTLVLWALTSLRSRSWSGPDDDTDPVWHMFVIFMHIWQDIHLYFHLNFRDEIPITNETHLCDPTSTSKANLKRVLLWNIFGKVAPDNQTCKHQPFIFYIHQLYFVQTHLIFFSVHLTLFGLYEPDF